MSIDADVVVVGAGPTGLLLAGDLARAGVGVTVLESRAEESNLTRAFAVHARTLEILDARGVADELVATGARVGSLRVFGEVGLDLSTLPSRFPYVLITPQYHTEQVLEKRALAAGAQIVRGARVTGVTQDAEGVSVAAAGPAGGRADETYRARYAVGTDGVRSTVRSALGLPFPGKSVVRSLMLADLRLTDPPEDVLAVNGVGDYFAFLVPFGDGWYRVIAWNRRHQLPDTAPVDFDEIRTAARAALGTDFGMHDPRWMSRFHSDERQVPRYRVDRVFLAGDAAHVHSPAGGQGMNTGLQDAANLGWKLAAAVQGRAPAGLLDTYHTERHPVGAMVLRGSGAIVRLALLRSGAVRAARNAVGVVALRIGPLTRKVTGMLSGIGIAYPAPRGAHPLVGKRAPDASLTGGGPTRLYEALRDGEFVLLGAAAPDGGVRSATATGGPVRLIRPDGYVAWAAEHPTPDELRAAVAQWVSAAPPRRR
jgi:2-polyprenyl-6-methoxyphenol hydroxylase-like FAD-dependent oxidoreductase